jgi:hypothetical protein
MTDTDVLDIKVMDNNSSGMEPIGGCQIRVSDLIEGAGQTQWYTLLYANKPAGQISIESRTHIRKQ